jgi:carbon storage regulator
MLVFTRKAGQSLMIGDDVEIKVLSIGTEQVRVGIDAPRKIPVHREEVYRSIVEQNRRASQSQLPSRELLRRMKSRR